MAKGHMRGAGAARGLLAVAGLLLLLGPFAHCAESMTRLSADAVRAWGEGGKRFFLLEGNARIAAPGGTVTGDSMLVRFDETASAEAASLTLEIYVESSGTGRTATLEAPGGLVVENEAASADGPPGDSDLLKRALFALDESSRPESSPDGVTQAVEAAPAAADDTAAAVEAESGDSIFDAVKSEAVEIAVAAIDSSGYNMTTRDVDSFTVWIITGGIEISFDEYAMRAGNMVIYLPEDSGEKVDRLQVYAEENIRFTTPSATLTAERLFFDYETGRATLVDAAVHARLTESDEPLIMRADLIRALSKQSFSAENAYVTTCEFGKPHYRLAAREAGLHPVSDDARGDSAVVVSRGNRLYVGDVPVLWLPRFSRNVKSTPVPLRRIQAGNSGEYGNHVYTEWDLLGILAGDSEDSWAARVSSWADVSALFDYRSKRGTGGGLALEYDRDGVTGDFLGYYIKDRGTDADGFVPPGDDRGRLRWRQRVLRDSLQIDTELSHISDRGFLGEYYERESKEAKEQETYIYVKRPWEHAQGSFLYRARLNDYQSQNEYLPQGRLDVAGYPVWDGRLLYGSTTRADNVRFRPDDEAGLWPYQTQRLDSWHSLEAPFAAPCGLTVTPFATLRGSWFDDTVGGSSAERFAGSWGAHLALPPVWRTWNVLAPRLDIQGLRHIANFDLTYEDVYDSTRRPAELLQFDDVDQVARGQMATLRLRQRLQTKRQPAEEGDPLRIVDVAQLDVEADFFPAPGRDNAGDNWSDMRLFSRINLTDDVSVIANGDYDTYGGRFNKAGVWLRVDQSPRTVWALGDRRIRATDATVLTARVDHVISDRWSGGVLAQYDHENGQLLDEELVLRRNLHQFALDVYVRYDKGRDETSVGVRFYPLGLLARSRAE